jgi:hypothetical protein
MKSSEFIDGWTSTNKQAITSLLADYIDQNLALSVVQLAFGEIDCQFFAIFEN